MNNESAGREAAEEFRVEFNLGAEPIVNMARLIERTMGIGVAYVDAPAPGHGMTMRLGDRYMMAVGCTVHPMRLRSTLAHELGHLRLSSVDRYLDHGDWEERTPEEIQADAFARHLLVPLDAAKAAANSAATTLALLSDLVQRYMASPGMVAIQLREIGAINQNVYREWSSMTSGSLASQFGWRAEYQALVDQARTPRAPQELLARATYAYRWDLITPAAIARLEGERDPRVVVERLETEGIRPMKVDDVTPARPTDAGGGLTAEELALLTGGAD